MPSSPHHQLGELLCQATREVLWAPDANDIRQQQKGSSLTCRVGHGQATYHRYDARDNQHLITYGARMVAAKQNPESAASWLSSREILQRRYFGGELSTLNLLAHTCCHEFAHLLQQVAGKRYRGSVHNRHFYGILDGLHRQGRARAVQDFLLGAAGDRGLALSATAFRVPDEQTLAIQWQVGDKVSFGKAPNWHQGHILKVNRKTCTVACPATDIRPGREVRYRVPVSLLRKVG